MTSAAARVSPGGLGDGAWVNAWRKEMCSSRSASMALRSDWEFMLNCRGEVDIEIGEAIDGLIARRKSTCS